MSSIWKFCSAAGEKIWSMNLDREITFLTLMRSYSGSSATSRIPVALLSARHSRDLPVSSLSTTTPRCPMITDRRHLKTVEHPLQPRPPYSWTHFWHHWSLEVLLATWRTSCTFLAALLTILVTWCRHGCSALFWPLNTLLAARHPF